MSSSETEIVMKSKLNIKNTKKPPPSPTADILKGPERKASTKEMVNKALTELKTRKGTSLYAIKKYIEESYHVDTEKISYIIKKYLKTAVEAGTIVQTKGVGASGSFRLATIKNKMEKKEKIKKIAKKMSSASEKDDAKPEETSKTKKKKDTKMEKNGKKEKNMEKKKEPKAAKKEDKKKDKMTKQVKDKEVKVKEPKPEKSSKEKKLKSKMALQLAQTPAKKRAAIIKRKSMGSIIKPPKMKPQK